MNALEIENLTYYYDKSIPLLSNLNLTVKQGEFLAIIGKNASGKSTLAKIIDGLITPISGKITVLGVDALDKNNIYEVRKKVGIVFQNPDNQTVASIVEDDVAFGPENIGVDREEIGKRIDFALSATKTEKFREQMVSKLSGGQKQRVAVAGVLAVKPDILILDESTSMLDPRGREEVMSVVKKLNKEGMTVITITHYMQEIVDCDRVALLYNGKIEKICTPQEMFFDKDLIKRAGLELPNTLKLSDELNKQGVNLSDTLHKEELLQELIEQLK